jgi:hypothetical protein
LLGTTLMNSNENEDDGILGFPGMVSRPLDFRTIDIRLAMGAYCGSWETFSEDVQEVRFLQHPLHIIQLRCTWVISQIFHGWLHVPARKSLSILALACARWWHRDRVVLLVLTASLIF